MRRLADDPELRTRLIQGMKAHLQRITQRDPHPVW